jgi:hypothetical protein
LTLISFVSMAAMFCRRLYGGLNDAALKPPLTEEERKGRAAAMDAAGIARALKGRKQGRGWMARCPAHNDCDPSLSINAGVDGKVLFKCHAGCPQDQVLAILRDRGLWNSCDDRPHLQTVTRPIDRDDDDKDRTAAALAIWNTSIPAQNTLVEVYLRARGITVQVPASLRFHPSLKHTPTGTIWPAMIALITGADGSPIAIHRTYLALNGTGKADVTPAKMTLGPCKGAAVRLGDEIQPGQWLAVAEGIETALSVMQSCGLSGWAALSAENLKVVKLPPQATMITVCADHDVNGAGQRAGRTLADRLLHDGRRVRVATPKIPGTDFNDELLKETQYVD